MLDEFTRSLFFAIVAAIAVASWIGGAYSIYRGMQALPDGQTDVPFFSADPELISEEGLKWRRRIYACMGYFALSLAIVVALRSGH
jgi:hypothetical protein